MKIFQVALLATLVALALSINPDQFEPCTHKAPCTQLRGEIDFNYNYLSYYDLYRFAGRSWVIRPTGDRKTTVTIVFKDFNIKKSIYVATKSGEKTYWREIGSSVGSKFEMIVSDVSSLAIHIPRDETGSFKAFYYVGCNILTSGSDEIEFPQMGHVVGMTSTCWVIRPIGIREMSRIYLTLRDVYLIEGARISVEELHTETKIARIDETMSYDIYGTDTVGHEMILVDLECDDRVGTCEKFGNLFSMSYYTVNKGDVNCIETQRHCALSPRGLPESVCSKSCPMLENMIEEEIYKEGPAFTWQAPILKTAPIEEEIKERAARNKTNSNEAKTDTEDESEEEEEEEEDAVDKRLIKPSKPKPKPIRCQIKNKYCKCLRTQNDAKKYCFSKRKCKTFGFCAIGCIWTRIIICAKMTSARSIKLLSG